MVGNDGGQAVVAGALPAGQPDMTQNVAASATAEAVAPAGFGFRKASTSLVASRFILQRPAAKLGSLMRLRKQQPSTTAQQKVYGDQPAAEKTLKSLYDQHDAVLKLTAPAQQPPPMTAEVTPAGPPEVSAALDLTRGNGTNKTSPIQISANEASNLQRTDE